MYFLNKTKSIQEQGCVRAVHLEREVVLRNMHPESVSLYIGVGRVNVGSEEPFRDALNTASIEDSSSINTSRAFFSELFQSAILTWSVAYQWQIFKTQCWLAMVPSMSPPPHIQPQAQSMNQTTGPINDHENCGLLATLAMPLRRAVRANSPVCAVSNAKWIVITATVPEQASRKVVVVARRLKERREQEKPLRQ